jgi:hypothetical protein
MTRHGAMQALAKALIEAGQPGQGRIVPLLLTDPGNAQPRYLRLPTWHTATYDGGTIQWG